MNGDEVYYNQLLITSGRITAYCNLIPVLLGLWQCKRFSAALWKFWYFIFATLMVNIIEVTFIWAVKSYTYFWLPYLKMFEIGDTNFLNILTVLKDFVFLGWAYSLLFDGAMRRGIRLASVILACYAVFDYLWITGYHVTGMVIPTINGVYVVALPMVYLWFLYRSNASLGMYKNPYFWFSAAQIVGHLTGLLFYFTGDKMYTTDFILFVKVSLVRNILFITRYLMYGYGFYMARYVRFVQQI